MKIETQTCPFCHLDNDVEILHQSETVVAFLDRFPVNAGHTLIIPKRHISSYFDLSEAEQQELWQVVNTCKLIIQNRFNPDGFNIGINIGEPAGQSIFHSHIHLIPRYKHDVENPMGGVRCVIPGKQKY